MKICVCILIFLSTFTFGLASFKLYESFSHPLKFKEEIISYAKEFNLSPALIASVINIESSFKVNAKSNKDAIGLMQIKLSTANYLNDLNNKPYIDENELFKPKTNIEYGCKYLKYLINKFEDINVTLASYNAGETRVRTWLKSNTYSQDGKTLKFIPFEETRNYVEKINKNYKFYLKIFNY